MSEQYFRLQLDDYAAPSIASWGKAYFGTLDEIRGLVEALAKDEKRRVNFAELIDAFRAYEAGNHQVTHHVAYQEVPLLEPVALLSRKVLRAESHAWTYLNTWGSPYSLRCDSVTAELLWLKTSEDICRAVKARLRNLQYEGSTGQWHPLADGFWGFPHMVEAENGCIWTRLAVKEMNHSLRKTAEEDMASFQSVQDVDLTGICQDIFGDG